MTQEGDTGGILRVGVRPGYEGLARMLVAALEHAQRHKGHARHGSSPIFEEQHMLTIRSEVGDGFTWGQALKKAREARRRGDLAGALTEIHGAIAYLAGEGLALERELGGAGRVPKR